MALLLEDMKDVQTATDLLVQRWATLEEPYLMEHVVIPEVYQGYRETEFPTVPFDADPAQIRTFEFTNLMAGRVIHLQDIVGDSEEVLDDLDVVLRLIRREISR